MKSQAVVDAASKLATAQEICNFDEICAFNRRGLFLGGCPKSGTTLLLSLLDGHPELVVLPEETHFLEEGGDYSALNNFPAKLRRLLEKSSLRLLAQGRWFEPLNESTSSDGRDYSGFDHPRFVSLAQSFANQPWVNDSLLFSETVRAYAITMGYNWRDCVRWVEKTTSNEAYSDDLFRLFPEAKLLQVVRDPRAVFASRKSRLTKRYGCYTKAHRLVREWNQSSRQIDKLQNCTDNYLVIRYEDLVRDTGEVLKKVSQFIGIEYLPVLFEPTRAGKNWQGNSSFHTAFSGVSARSVEQWKGELTEQEIWWIEMHCREGMQLAGYQMQTGGKFSFGRWSKRLPGESWSGYLRARRGSLCQLAGALEDCRYNANLVPAQVESHSVRHSCSKT